MTSTDDDCAPLRVLLMNKVDFDITRIMLSHRPVSGESKWREQSMK